MDKYLYIMYFSYLYITPPPLIPAGLVPSEGSRSFLYRVQLSLQVMPFEVQSLSLHISSSSASTLCVMPLTAMTLVLHCHPKRRVQLCMWCSTTDSTKLWAVAHSSASDSICDADHSAEFQWLMVWNVGEFIFFLYRTLLTAIIHLLK
jgi:hypothetical protein